MTWMTLNGRYYYYAPCCTIHGTMHVFSRPTAWKRRNIDTCIRQKCSQRILVFGNIIIKNQHCHQSLLPPVKSQNHNLRPKGYIYQIPKYSTEYINVPSYHIAYSNIINSVLWFTVLFYSFTILTALSIGYLRLLQTT